MPTAHTPACFVDVHVLQSVPVSTLNRDDLNAVKTVDYGGVRRTRVSSQSWKRALREEFQEEIGQYATRTRRICKAVADVLEGEEHGWDRQQARQAGAHIVAASGIKFEIVGKPGEDEYEATTNGLVYLSSESIEELAVLATQHPEKIKKKKIEKKTDKSQLPAADVQEIIRRGNLVIHTFGRMLTEVNEAHVDGAVQVAHAFTTHRSDVQVDYFTAVDDLTAAWGETGSGHLSEAEFSAGTFYRFATIDVRELLRNVGKAHPSDPRDASEDARNVAGAFLSSFIRSLPQAKKNSTAPHTAPDLVHISVRSDRPLSFAAAFETPVRSAQGGGHSAASRDQLVEYAQAATTLMGSDRILADHWAGTGKDVDGLGTRVTSFDALVQAGVEAAFAPLEGGA
ncbi:type I-E CRISPR-associated protein Cas7/Cse4/CasC [Streptomyces sp. SL13]|uniref:Type I-E CRISPR-associated protein Cas7/Cse4/CasC n=1 Tax=Streptantibioticus silvisoli TaxID=2705255 RepID=A0AA90KF79_9ACTN|nr:type I-E CRISPR-associated protein Cas7/Cse4/CasC [Streptantibioticus silvisoli]MDI5968609.1 type I-E CRISPR-associated protein Cas7/Cse4/CasC [Streptantibioticus silvisoli]